MHQNELPPQKKTLKFAQKLENVLLLLRKQNHIGSSLKEVLTTR